MSGIPRIEDAPQQSGASSMRGLPGLCFKRLRQLSAALPLATFSVPLRGSKEFSIRFFLTVFLY
jgi:hypothetical protein